MLLFKMLHVMFAILTSLIALNAVKASTPAIEVSAIPAIHHDPANTTIANLERRSNFDGQPSGLGITTFINANCDASIHYVVDPFIYGSDYTYSIAVASMILTRDMQVGEQLDFSGGPGANPPCYPFIQDTAPSQVGPIYGGVCYKFPPVTCLRLWHY